MNTRQLADSEIPYFCWDRKLSAGEIRHILSSDTDKSWLQTASLVMREAAFADVWQFLRPVQVRDNLDKLLPFLGRKKEFWSYIIGEWRELGKF